MIGKLLSNAVKIISVPLDIGEAVMDCMTGGDGSKESRQRMADSVPCLSTARDAVCDVLEEIDQ